MRVRIKHWRKFRQMTQQELAALMGISQPTLSRLETGQTSITLAALNQCATALDIPLEALYSIDAPNGQEHPHA
jgi:transcriptional regulator with XRE-family HTH domain